MKLETLDNLEQQDAIAATSLSDIDAMLDAYEEELESFLTTFGGIAYHDLYSTISYSVEAFCLDAGERYHLDRWMIMDDLGRYIAEGRIYLDSDHALYDYMKSFIELWEDSDGEV